MPEDYDAASWSMGDMNRDQEEIFVTTYIGGRNEARRVATRMNERAEKEGRPERFKVITKPGQKGFFVQGTRPKDDK